MPLKVILPHVHTAFRLEHKSQNFCRFIRSQNSLRKEILDHRRLCKLHLLPVLDDLLEFPGSGFRKPLFQYLLRCLFRFLLLLNRFFCGSLGYRGNSLSFYLFKRSLQHTHPLQYTGQIRLHLRPAHLDQCHLCQHSFRCGKPDLIQQIRQYADIPDHSLFFHLCCLFLHQTELLRRNFQSFHGCITFACQQKISQIPDEIRDELG